MKKQLANFVRFFKVFFSRGLITQIAFAFVVIAIIAAILAPVIAPYDPNKIDPVNKFADFSTKHLLGTDSTGRDIFSRVLYGARISILLSLLSGIVSAVIGVFFGLLAGYAKGVVSQVIMRAVDAILSFPPIIFTLVIALIFGKSIFGLTMTIGLSMMPNYVRMVYGLVLSLSENDYVVAARIVGTSDAKIMFRHLLPNCIPNVLVMFAMNLGGAIMLESTLGFLGLGIAPPTATWGGMVSEGFGYIFTYPALTVVPGICITMVVIGFNIVGDALRDSLDPRLRGKI